MRHFCRRMGESCSTPSPARAARWPLPNFQAAVALDWQQQETPNKVWAQGYDPAFDEAMIFLQESKRTHETEIAAKEKQRRQQLRRTRIFAAILASAFLIAIIVGIFAIYQWREADRTHPGSINFRCHRIDIQGQERITGKLRFCIFLYGSLPSRPRQKRRM